MSTEIDTLATELKCVAPRVTKDLIESRIKSVDYQTVIIAGHKFMYCGIEMDNGYVVVGKPATCVDPANWRDEIGQQVSYSNSLNEIWALEGYRLATELSV